MICSTKKVFEFTAAVRGLHFFRSAWIPREEDKLTCHHEENNAFDVYPIKIITESNQIVGHLPREISRITKFLLDRGVEISCTNYCQSPLPQGGLETPCKDTVNLPSTIKNRMILGQSEKLVITYNKKKKKGDFREKKLSRGETFANSSYCYILRDQTFAKILQIREIRESFFCKSFFL